MSQLSDCLSAANGKYDRDVAACNMLPPGFAGEAIAFCKIQAHIDLLRSQAGCYAQAAEQAAESILNQPVAFGANVGQVLEGLGVAIIIIELSPVLVLGLAFL